MVAEDKGETEKVKVKAPNVSDSRNWWKRRGSVLVDADVRSGTDDHGTHGKGERANIDGRTSRKLRIRGPIRQTIKQAVAEEAEELLH